MTSKIWFSFYQKFNGKHGRSITGIQLDAVESLKTYHWPGNIRELENTIERAFVMESGNTITKASIPDSIIQNRHQSVEIPLGGNYVGP